MVKKLTEKERIQKLERALSDTKKELVETNKELMKAAKIIVKNKKEPKQEKLTKIKTEYTSEDIKAISDIKKRHSDLSIRKVASLFGVPKSVVGRWIKEPEKAIRKTQVKEIKKQIDESGKTEFRGFRKIYSSTEVKINMDKFLKEIEKNGTEKQKAKLLIRYDEVVGWMAIS